MVAECLVLIDGEQSTIPKDLSELKWVNWLVTTQPTQCVTPCDHGAGTLAVLLCTMWGTKHLGYHSGPHGPQIWKNPWQPKCGPVEPPIETPMSRHCPGFTTGQPLDSRNQQP